MERRFFVAQSVKRTKTKYAGIYLNENTKKYDIKCNYKVYNPVKQKNEYKQKWKYGISTLTEAKIELAKMQSGGVSAGDKDITLEGAHQLWLIKADNQNFSPKSVKNTASHLNMLYQFIPKETRMKDITEGMYEKVMSDVRKHGYSEETIYNINATFRKLIRLCYKKKLITTNILEFADNIRTKDKEDYRVIPQEEFDKINNYFKTHSFVRLGVNNYPKYRFMFSLLYYTGIRLGECLALQYDDFEDFSYFKKGTKPKGKPLENFPSNDDLQQEHLTGTRVKITKAYLSDFKVTKDPKNFKKRAIPLAPAVVRLYQRLQQENILKGGTDADKIFEWGHGACNNMLQKACRELQLPLYHCHEFRHTFISNMIREGVPLPVISKVSGDTQETILKRYSHMFESDEIMILQAISNMMGYTNRETG